MNVNSTAFQQNVGFYLKLAQSGAVLNIIKSKPTRSLYQLKAIDEVKVSKSRVRLEKFFKKLEKNSHKFDFYGKDAVKFVRGIRE